MIQVTPQLAIDEKEIQLDFVRSSGPGGQNVNKVSTAVELRFNVQRSSLPEAVRARLARLAAHRINSDGELIIDARSFRTQEQNRQDAIDRLAEWVRRAATIPKPRRKTQPSRAEKRRRLENKRRRGEVKGLRSQVGDAD